MQQRVGLPADAPCALVVPHPPAPARFPVACPYDVESCGPESQRRTHARELGPSALLYVLSVRQYVGHGHLRCVSPPPAGGLRLSEPSDTSRRSMTRAARRTGCGLEPQDRLADRHPSTSPERCAKTNPSLGRSSPISRIRRSAAFFAGKPRSSRESRVTITASPGRSVVAVMPRFESSPFLHARPVVQVARHSIRAGSRSELAGIVPDLRDELATVGDCFASPRKIPRRRRCARRGRFGC